MSTLLLSTQQLSKSFGAVEVLHGIDFDLEPGEVHAVIGENGAGKSTLMKLLGGYLQPTSGRIFLSGEPVSFRSSADAEARGIILIHQELNLAEDLSVEANIFLGRERHKGPLLRRREMAEAARALLMSLETPLDPHLRVRELSVSQKQMVEIAKAVSREARILIMDEPTDVLTGRETEVLFELIRRLKAQGVTVVYISHKLSEVSAISDRVTILRDGARVTTRPSAQLSQEEMASLMVGRALNEMYPEKKPPTAEVVLALERFAVPGWTEPVSFALHRGEVLGFAGLIGAGRTELFEGLVGIRPHHGAVYRLGKRVRIRTPNDAADLGIVYVSEDRKGKGIIGSMPLRPNLTLLALGQFVRFGGLIDTRAEWRALEEAVATFDIRVPSLRAKASDLSGGNQQKLVLAKYMLIDPEVIILDEPTRGIDVGTKRQIYFFIHQLAQEGKAVILISSEMSELIGLAHRVAVMRAGRLVGMLTGERKSEEEIVRYATGLKADATLEQMREADREIRA